MFSPYHRYNVAFFWHYRRNTLQPNSFPLVSFRLEAVILVGNDVLIYTYNI